MRTIKCRKHGVVSGDNIRRFTRSSGKHGYKCKLCSRAEDKKYNTEYRKALQEKRYDHVTTEFLAKMKINPDLLSDRVIAGKHVQLRALKQGLIINNTTGDKNEY